MKTYPHREKTPFSTYIFTLIITIDREQVKSIITNHVIMHVLPQLHINMTVQGVLYTQHIKICFPTKMKYFKTIIMVFR